MEDGAYQQLVITSLSDIKTRCLNLENKMNTTCTTLAEVKTTQQNFLSNHEKKINQSTDKKFRMLGILIGVPTIIFQVLQYTGVI